MNDENKDLDKFELGDITTDETMETMTEYVTDETLNNESFQESTGQPPKTTEIGLDEKKKKSKIPIIIFGVIGFIVVLLLAAGLFGGSGGQKGEVETNNTIIEAQEEETKEDMSDEIVINSDEQEQINDKSDLNIVGETNINEQSDLSLTQDENKNNAILGSDEIETKEVKKIEQEKVSVEDVDPLPLQSEVGEVAVISKNVTDNTDSSTVAKILSPDELRKEAKKLNNKATVIENYGNIDSELLNKTPEEQVEYLKDKVIKLQVELLEKSKLVQKKNITKDKVAKKEKNLTADAIVYGQVWINNKSYVVGDKLPNNSVIKKINVDDKLIVTTKGNIKLKE